MRGALRGGEAGHAAALWTALVSWLLLATAVPARLALALALATIGIDFGIRPVTPRVLPVAVKSS